MHIHAISHAPPPMQCNHRSWADFFLDIYLTEGLAAPMSRAMVFFAFPVFVTSVIALKGILLFKRGTIANKDVSLGGGGIANRDLN